MHRALGAMVAAAFLLAACSAGEPGSPSASASASPAIASRAPSAPASASGHAAVTPSAAALSSDPLHAVQLLDVTDGQVLVIGALAAGRPLLLETMAIWCTNCRMQQDQVSDAHAFADFTSISLDVDPTELPADLASYAAQHGYDWHFAKATAAVANQLRSRFGTSVLNPPSTPKILFRPDGSVTALDFNRIYSAADLASLINAGP
jgi:hypothetical protein